MMMPKVERLFLRSKAPGLSCQTSGGLIFSTIYLWESSALLRQSPQKMLSTLNPFRARRAEEE
jgi:hypothetical protein